MNWTGPVHKNVSLAEVQRLAKVKGAARERRTPVARIALCGSKNVGTAFDAEGNALFDFGWRPFERQHADVNGLFLC